MGYFISKENLDLRCAGCRGFFAKHFGHRCQGGTTGLSAWVSCGCELCNKTSKDYDPGPMMALDYSVPEIDYKDLLIKYIAHVSKINMYKWGVGLDALYAPDALHDQKILNIDEWDRLQELEIDSRLLTGEETDD